MELIVTNLQTLYTSQDSEARLQANSFLQEFQKQPEAWNTASSLLSAANAPLEAKLFAGQTFRSKITYDLEDLSSTDRMALRDTLLVALKATTANNGPRAVQRQIALSLADLMLQLPEWKNGVQDMIESLGRDPSTANVLLVFLAVLAEEAATNGRIDPTNNDILTPDNARQVIQLLSLYASASGITAELKGKLLDCLAAWLGAGGIPAEMVGNSALFDFAFEAVRSYDLFDSAVEIICALIHETQEIDDNVQIIQKIVPRLIELNPLINDAREDEERMRGFTRILAETEWYVPLMFQHPSTFLPIVQAAAECCRSSELDIVQITFSFWYKLSRYISQYASTSASSSIQPFLDIFLSLVDTIIQHLRYPDDNTSMLPQERDDFREFRHNIGDTLKDCSAVLGANTCLKRAIDMISVEIAKGASEAKWQNIEAPLFAMRSIGGQVDPRDDNVLPEIMNMLPKLPAHPKLRYAAILVISRYTEWTDLHPQHIPFQLEYVSAGFGDADTEVWLASANALKFLCLDCSQHLVTYLPQLHNFLEENGARLPLDDLLNVTEGISCVIRVITPPEQALKAMSLFCDPLLQQMYRIATSPTTDRGQLKLISNAMERLSILLKECYILQSHVPSSCSKTIQDAWQIVNTVLQSHGDKFFISEPACTLIRRAYDFFYSLMLPLAPAVIQRMTSTYQATGASGYLWITGKFASFAKVPGGETTFQALSTAFDVQSRKTFEIIPTKTLVQSQDILEDYLALCSAIFQKAPEVLLLSPHLPPTLLLMASAFSLSYLNVLRAALDYFIDLIGHESLSPTPPATAQLEFAAPIRAAVQQTGHEVVSAIFIGLITTFEESSTAITAFRLLAERFPNELVGWLSTAIERLPPKSISQTDLAAFVQEFKSAMDDGSLPRVRSAFIKLDRVTKRFKTREWQEQRDAKRMGLPALIGAE